MSLLNTLKSIPFYICIRIMILSFFQKKWCFFRMSSCVFVWASSWLISSAQRSSFFWLSSPVRPLVECKDICVPSQHFIPLYGLWPFYVRIDIIVKFYYLTITAKLIELVKKKKWLIDNPQNKESDMNKFKEARLTGSKMWEKSWENVWGGRRGYVF